MTQTVPEIEEEKMFEMKREKSKLFMSYLIYFLDPLISLILGIICFWNFQDKSTFAIIIGCIMIFDAGASYKKLKIKFNEYKVKLFYLNNGIKKINNKPTFTFLDLDIFVEVILDNNNEIQEKQYYELINKFDIKKIEKGKFLLSDHCESGQLDNLTIDEIRRVFSAQNEINKILPHLYKILPHLYFN